MNRTLGDDIKALERRRKHLTHVTLVLSHRLGEINRTLERLYEREKVENLCEADGVVRGQDPRNPLQTV